MSYCRWSSDDFQCDVYVYEGHCFITHVANRKRVFKEPLPPKEEISTSNMDKYLKRHRKVMEICKSSDLEPLNLPYDGEYFEHDTAKGCAENLMTLKKAGYNVPQYAIDALLEESE